MEPTADLPTPPPPVLLRGSCSCSLVSYTSSSLPISMTLCHCTTCRKLSGAPFLSFGLFHNNALIWSSSSSQAETDIKLSASPIAIRGSCRRCGSPLFMKYHCRPDGTSVTMGIADEGTAVGAMVRPKEHIFLSEKAGWWEISESDGLERHEAFNEPFQRRLAEWEAQGKKKRNDVGDVQVDFSVSGRGEASCRSKEW